MPRRRRVASLDGMTAETAPRVPAPGRYVGPPPVVPAVVLVVTLGLSLAIGGAAGVFHRPDAVAADVLARAQEHATAVGWVAFLQLLSAVALGVLSAALSTVLQARGLRVAGVATARIGGGAAAVLLAVSALCTWSTAQVADAATAKALAVLAFATGGPGHVAMLGLLFAGIGLPVVLGRLPPRWLGVTGLVLYAAAELAALSLVTDAAQVLLPVARFAGLLWLVAAAVTLPGPVQRSAEGRWEAAPVA
jgi:hypothetical protein